MPSILELVDPRQLAAAAVAFLPRLVSAFVVLVAFWILLRLTTPALRAALRRADFAPALIQLLVDNVYRGAVIVLGLVMGASQLGIDVGAALAGVGVAGIAVGFAAQDTLANIISGFLIFWDKPFHVGHFITTQGNYGEVVEITMRTTRIRTQENTYVVIPNKEIIQGVLVNHTLYGETRVNVPVGIAYKENVPEARRVILEAVRGLEGVIAQPAPDVVMTALGSSSVDMMVRVWVSEPASERPVFFRTLEASKLALDDAGIQIPYHHLQLFIDDIEDEVFRKAGRLLESKGAAS